MNTISELACAGCDNYTSGGLQDLWIMQLIRSSPVGLTSGFIFVDQSLLKLCSEEGNSQVLIRNKTRTSTRIVCPISCYII